MAVKSKITQGSMELTVDLEEVFGDAIEDASLRQEIGQAFLDKIVSRTEGGTRLGGGKFKGYSKAYQESLAYRVAGKTNDVNLRLTGDMLETLDIKDDTPSKIKLGWDSATQNAKAFNHHTGDTLPKRPFFGLQKNEIEEVASEFIEKVRIKNNLQRATNESDFRSRAVDEIRKILGSSEDEDG